MPCQASPRRALPFRPMFVQYCAMSPRFATTGAPRIHLELGAKPAQMTTKQGQPPTLKRRPMPTKCRLNVDPMWADSPYGRGVTLRQ